MIKCFNNSTDALRPNDIALPVCNDLYINSQNNCRSTARLMCEQTNLDLDYYELDLKYYAYEHNNPAKNYYCRKQLKRYNLPKKIKHLMCLDRTSSSNSSPEEQLLLTCRTNQLKNEILNNLDKYDGDTVHKINKVSHTLKEIDAYEGDAFWLALETILNENLFHESPSYLLKDLIDSWGKQYLTKKDVIALPWRSKFLTDCIRKSKFLELIADSLYAEFTRKPPLTGKSIVEYYLFDLASKVLFLSKNEDEYCEIFIYDVLNKYNDHDNYFWKHCFSKVKNDKCNRYFIFHWEKVLNMLENIEPKTESHQTHVIQYFKDKLIYHILLLFEMKTYSLFSDRNHYDGYPYPVDYPGFVSTMLRVFEKYKNIKGIDYDFCKRTLLSHGLKEIAKVSADELVVYLSKYKDYFLEDFRQKETLRETVLFEILSSIFEHYNKDVRHCPGNEQFIQYIISSEYLQIISNYRFAPFFRNINECYNANKSEQKYRMDNSEGQPNKTIYSTDLLQTLLDKKPGLKWTMIKYSIALDNEDFIKFFLDHNNKALVSDDLILTGVHYTLGWLDLFLKAKNREKEESTISQYQSIAKMMITHKRFTEIEIDDKLDIMNFIIQNLKEMKTAKKLTAYIYGNIAKESSWHYFTSYFYSYNWINYKNFRLGYEATTVQNPEQELPFSASENNEGGRPLP